MKLIEVGRDDVSDGTRVVVEHTNGERVTWVQESPRAPWRDTQTGEWVFAHHVAKLEPLLWLHRREEARKSRETAVQIVEGLGQALAHAQGEPVGRTHFVTGAGAVGAGGGGSCTVHTGGLLTLDEFLGAQQGVRSGEAADTEPRDVRLHRAVMAVLVEPLWDVEVRLELFPETPPTLVEAEGRNWWVARSASTEGLKHLREAITAELTRRGER